MQHPKPCLCHSLHLSYLPQSTAATTTHSCVPSAMPQHMPTLWQPATSGCQQQRQLRQVQPSSSLLTA
jgi:hypothetical protein